MAERKTPERGFPPAAQGIRFVDALDDSELAVLNRLLPWNAFTVDGKGRRFGSVAWSGKRVDPQDVDDRRIGLMDDAFGLRGSSVLEIGCFEGIHTVGLCRAGAEVVAVDARVENVAKTLVRCAMYDCYPRVLPFDAEDRNADFDLVRADLAHHVGVLYHLSDPVSHILDLGRCIRRGVMLDTHVARPEQATERYQIGGQDYRFMRYQEHGRADVFSGMHDHAKWLIYEDLEQALACAGFAQVELVEERDERNGLRVLLFASRTGGD